MISGRSASSGSDGNRPECPLDGMAMEQFLSSLDRPFRDQWQQRQSHRRNDAVFEDLDSLSDEEILSRTKKMTCLPNSNGRVFRLLPTVAVKYGCWEDIKAEALSMQLIEEQTDIQIPRLLKVIDYCDEDPDWRGAIVMEWIPNATSIVDIWPSLSIWHKLFVLLQLRYYVRQIRNVTHPSSAKPGPPGSESLPCYSFTFGPAGMKHWKSQDDVLLYFEEKYTRTKKTAVGNKADDLEPLAISKILPLIFTHNDLNPCNILIDDRHQVWIIDWGSAGFYPPFFEYTTTRSTACFTLQPEWFLHNIGCFTWPDEEVERWMARTGSDWNESRERYLRFQAKIDKTEERSAA